MLIITHLLSLLCILVPSSARFLLRCRSFGVSSGCWSWGCDRCGRCSIWCLWCRRVEKLQVLLLFSKELELITNTYTPVKEEQNVSQKYYYDGVKAEINLFKNTYLWLIYFVVLCRPSSTMKPFIKPSLSRVREIIRDSSLPMFISNPRPVFAIPFVPLDKTIERETRRQGLLKQMFGGENICGWGCSETKPKTMIEKSSRVSDSNSYLRHKWLI